MPHFAEVWSYINPFMLYGKNLGYKGNFEKDLAQHVPLAIELFHQCLTILFTKIPGVTTCSGSMSPNSTVSRTCTTVVFAAIAMIGRSCARSCGK